MTTPSIIPRAARGHTGRGSRGGVMARTAEEGELVLQALEVIFDACELASARAGPD